MDALPKEFKQQLAEQFPVLNKYPRALVQGPNDSNFQGEYYQKGERDSPDPSQNVQALPRGATPEYAAGELLHQLSHSDPHYRYLMQQYEKAIPLKQRQIDQQMYRQHPDVDDGKPVHFNQAWNQDLREAVMRAYLLPNQFGSGMKNEEAVGWKERMQRMTPQQKQILDAIKAYFFQKQGESTYPRA